MLFVVHIEDVGSNCAGSLRELASMTSEITVSTGCVGAVLEVPGPPRSVR
jgi:hypothetical protein